METEICQAIREFLPCTYTDKSDDFIIKYCSFYPLVMKLICNDGYTIKQAIKLL